MFERLSRVIVLSAVVVIKSLQLIELVPVRPRRLALLAATSVASGISRHAYGISDERLEG